MSAETIDHATLSRLVEAGAVQGTHIIGQPGGWAVMIQFGMQEHPLAAQRSRNVRVFRRFETLVSYLKDIGIARFDVDSSDYTPDGINTTRRPDRAEALRRAHEAAAYDVWFRQQVQASIDDPRPGIPHDEVESKFTAKREALRRRMGNR